jgi:hypothetical protein
LDFLVMVEFFDKITATPREPGAFIYFESLYILMRKQ